MELAEAITRPRVPNVTARRCARLELLGRVGTLVVTGHHLIFSAAAAQDDSASELWVRVRRALTHRPMCSCCTSRLTDVFARCPPTPLHRTAIRCRARQAVLVCYSTARTSCSHSLKSAALTTHRPLHVLLIFCRISVGFDTIYSILACFSRHQATLPILLPSANGGNGGHDQQQCSGSVHHRRSFCTQCAVAL